MNSASVPMDDAHHAPCLRVAVKRKALSVLVDKVLNKKRSGTQNTFHAKLIIEFVRGPFSVEDYLKMRKDAGKAWKFYLNHVTIPLAECSNGQHVAERVLGILVFGDNSWNMPHGYPALDKRILERASSILNDMTDPDTPMPPPPPPSPPPPPPAPMEMTSFERDSGSFNVDDYTIDEYDANYEMATAAAVEAAALSAAKTMTELANATALKSELDAVRTELAGVKQTMEESKMAAMSLELDAVKKELAAFKHHMEATMASTTRLATEAAKTAAFAAGHASHMTDTFNEVVAKRKFIEPEEMERMSKASRVCMDMVNDTKAALIGFLRVADPFLSEK